MQSFSEFKISHFEWDETSLVARFHYNFDAQEFFVEEICFAAGDKAIAFPLKNQNPDQISHFLRHIHIALGVSYYKLYPTKTIFVNTFQLSEAQKAFWHAFYIKGLGEFFYRNELDPRGLGNFISNNNAAPATKPLKLQEGKNLVLFGGGKDSLVSVELLKKSGQDFDLFSFGKDYPLHQLAQAPTGAQRVIIQRKLDLAQIQKLIAQGYYNGHVPITGAICFVSSLVCYLYGYSSIITSLEKSADFGNTEYCGMEINHQWSKSQTFQAALQEYFHKFIAENLICKSLLSQRYEIKIIQEFSKFPQYFKAFSSCNRNFHIENSQLSTKQLWCGVCPKCAFVYTLLRAFLEIEQVNEIFGQNLFEKDDLLPLFKELMGIDGIKPFECVGTNEEMILALWLIWKKEEQKESPIMQLFIDEILAKMEAQEFYTLEKKLLE